MSTTQASPVTSVAGQDPDPLVNLQTLEVFVKQKPRKEDWEANLNPRERKPQILVSTCYALGARQTYKIFSRIFQVTFSTEKPLTIKIEGNDTVGQPAEIGGSNVSGFTWRSFERW